MKKNKDPDDKDVDNYRQTQEVESSMDMFVVFLSGPPLPPLIPSLNPTISTSS